MSKKFKRIISLLMAAVMMLCSGLAANAMEIDTIINAEWPEYEGAYYGRCGRDVEYVVYPDGELVIFGTGDMADYSHNKNSIPWNEHAKNITTVTIEEGVTNIGSHAFWWLNNMNYLYIPESVERIGVCSIWFDSEEYNEIIYAGSEDDWYDIEFDVGDGYSECGETLYLCEFALGFNGEAPIPYCEFVQPDTAYVNYGDTLVLWADSGNLPEGAWIYWEASYYGSEVEFDQYDECCYIRSTGNGATEVTIGIAYEDGSVEYYDTIEIETRSNFFLIIISIFKDIFGLNRFVY